jgi:hypothetical protein
VTGAAESETAGKTQADQSTTAEVVASRRLGINITAGIPHITAQLQAVFWRKAFPTFLLANILRRRFMATSAAISLLPALGQAAAIRPAMPPLRRCKRRCQAQP